jgi:hypothetical protein
LWRGVGAAWSCAAAAADDDDDDDDDGGDDALFVFWSSWRSDAPNEKKQHTAVTQTMLTKQQQRRCEKGGSRRSVRTMNLMASGVKRGVVAARRKAQGNR